MRPTSAHSPGGKGRSLVMQLAWRILMWPVISILITGALHFTLEAIWPDLKAFFTPSTVGPVVLFYGLWVGYRAIKMGGSYVNAIVAGAVLGILPIVLDVVGFGMILNRGVTAGELSGIFSWAVIVFGTLIGAGFAMSGEAKSAT
jgi:hypothetical protein